MPQFVVVCPGHAFAGASENQAPGLFDVSAGEWPGNRSESCEKNAVCAVFSQWRAFAPKPTCLWRLERRRSVKLRLSKQDAQAHGYIRRGLLCLGHSESAIGPPRYRNAAVPFTKIPFCCKVHVSFRTESLVVDETETPVTRRLAVVGRCMMTVTGAILVRP
jgi:hypothetical protein